MARRVLVFTVLFILLAGQAMAQIPGRYRGHDRAGRWEISLQTRWVDGRSISSAGGSSLSLKDDMGWGFGLGYNVNDGFNLGFNVSWRSVPYTATIIDAADPALDEVYAGYLDASSFVFSGTWTPLEGKFSPYVNGGLGWMAIDTNIAAGVNTGCWWDPWWGYVCDTYVSTYGVDTEMYNLGAGVRLALNPDLFLRVGYERAWTGNSVYDGSDAIRLDLGGLL